MEKDVCELQILSLRRSINKKKNKMFEIKKATLEDIELINKLAWIVFPHTYQKLLTPGQVEFMMEWMYSPTNLHKQMTEDGHIYYIAFQGNEPAGYLSIQPEDEHIYHLQKIYVLLLITQLHSEAQKELRALGKLEIPREGASRCSTGTVYSKVTGGCGLGSD